MFAISVQSSLKFPFYICPIKMGTTHCIIMEKSIAISIVETPSCWQKILLSHLVFIMRMQCTSLSLSSLLFLSLWTLLIMKPLRKTPRRMFLILSSRSHLSGALFKGGFLFFYYIFFLFLLRLSRNVRKNRGLICKRMRYASIFKECVFHFFFFYFCTHSLASFKSLLSHIVYFLRDFLLLELNCKNALAIFFKREI